MLRAARNASDRLGVVIPVGAVEQHGAHLPVTCDTDIAVGAAAAVSDALEQTGRYRAWVAPAIPYGPVPGADLTPGTSAVSFDVLGAYLSAVVDGFAVTRQWDFLVMVNAHAHNHGRVIEASSRAFTAHRVPAIVLQVYEFMSVCDGLDLVPGSHGAEFEIALHHFYTGASPIPGRVPDVTPRPRPASIYGLDLLPRSRGGIIGPNVPDVDRARRAAPDVGRRINAAMAARAIGDLDTFEAHWRESQDREAR